MLTIKELCEQLLEAYDTVVEPRHMQQKRQGGQDIHFLPQHAIKNYLDVLAPGWEWDLGQPVIGGKRLYLVGRLTLRGDDGKASRCATGCEELDCSSYGDPSSNAEAMALRRAAMAFGFCRQLWAMGKHYRPPGSKRAPRKTIVTLVSKAAPKPQVDDFEDRLRRLEVPALKLWETLPPSAQRLKNGESVLVMAVNKARAERSLAPIQRFMSWADEQFNAHPIPAPVDARELADTVEPF